MKAAATDPATQGDARLIPLDRARFLLCAMACNKSVANPARCTAIGTREHK